MEQGVEKVTNSVVSQPGQRYSAVRQRVLVEEEEGEVMPGR